MNTLLGEVATLNDVRYHRYRTAFKFRKLQKSFLLDHLNVTVLQDVFHQTGVQNLPRGNEVFLTQLRSTLNELYSTLKISRPLLRGAKLHHAQEQLYNWLQMAFRSSSGNKIEAGALKITLALFTGSNSYDKARYFFSVLAANAGGAVDMEGIGYFLSVTQQLGSSVQEHLYPHWKSAEEVFRECLLFVRSAEDIEDEEEWDGSIRNQFLSQFEFTKLFTTLPEPKFLRWMALWHRLPTMEKVVHSVRCSVCTRKPIISFRYQCTQCPSFNLCQMCFLKGRTTEKHLPSHKVLEYSNPTKGQWHHRLLGLGTRGRGGKVWEEAQEPFIYSPRSSVVNFMYSPKKEDPKSEEKKDSEVDNGQIDTPINSITEMMNSSQETERNSVANGTHTTHQPAIIRIGSDDTPTNTPTSTTHNITAPIVKQEPRKEAHPPSGGQPINIYNISPDSVSSAGQRFNFDGPLSCAGSDLNATRSSLGNLSSSTAGSEGPMFYTQQVQTLGSRYRSSTMAPASSALPQDQPKVATVQRSHSYTARDRKRLAEMNKRLSMEVDQLLSELPSDYPPMGDPPSKTNTERLHKLHIEERSLQNQVNRLRNQRERLASELQGLITQVQHMHSGFMDMSNGVRTPSPPTDPVHTRYPSAPSEIYPQNVPRPMTAPTSLSQPVMQDPHSRLHRHAHLLDPLVEFTPEQLKESREEVPENYRLSVAW